MSDPYIGEIRLFAGQYAPRDWALCQGQTLPINGNEALFTLIGSLYGGDGRTTFGIPDMRGLVACGTGQAPPLAAYTLGQTVGIANASVSEAQMPAHTHTLNASNTAATSLTPGGNLFANAVPSTSATPAPSFVLYANNTATGSSLRNLENTAIVVTGGGVPHTNVMPSLAVSYIICLQGIFPNLN